MDIAKEQLEELLTESCPSFLSSVHWKNWQEENTQSNGSQYFFAGEFVRHLTSKNALAERNEFPAVFAMIEKLLQQGDDFVINWATIGILESFQNEALHLSNSKPDDFEKYLHPVSKWWWEELNLFWMRKLSGPAGSSGRPQPAGMGNSTHRVLKIGT
jgi:hypothetical protein